MSKEGQSPIDLVVSEESIGDRPAPTYHSLSRATLTDTGSTVSVSVEPGGLLLLNSRHYALTEIHSHSQSEHTIRGRRSDLEVHFVHETTDGSIAVIGLLFDAHPASQPIDGLVRPPMSRTEQLAEPVTLSRLIPRESRRFLYTGSRTTVPYTGNVQWIVFETTQWVGQDALDAFIDRYGENHRDLQPVGDRTVILV